MSLTKRYTLTAALPYANGPVHIGHLAGVYVPADIFARYLRLNQKEVAFICGSDEHGVPITLKAKKEGISPQDVVDRYHTLIKQSFQDFGITFDNYSRTSSEIHKKTASEFFQKLHSEGKFIEDTTEQYFDEAENQFLADRYIMGECPNCHEDNAYGDQCEKCGSSLNARELINPKSTISGNKPILKETKHWFLPLDQYESFLQKWIVEGHKNDWKSNVLGQVKSWIDAGLQPRAVTRDLDWGIPVPLENAEGKVLYVWFDAPIGYISSTIEKYGTDWEKFWKDEETELIHFIGKDNIVFHCIIFPAMLQAHGDYILPTNVPANEFLNLENDKISTSRNWAVWLHEYLEDFPNQQDVLRYVLTANMPETKDNNFTWKDFQTRNNSELVGILGNFVNRVGVLTNKYYEGIVPKPNELNEVDQTVLKEIRAHATLISEKLEKYLFRDALAAMMNIARIGNKYLADEEPWKLIKTDEARVQTIMYVALQVVGNLAHTAAPFLPFTAEKLQKMFAVPAINNWKELADENHINLPSGIQINTVELLFSQVEDAVIESQIEKLAQSKQNNSKTNANAKAQKEMIEFDDFQKVDIRIGTVLAAQKIEKADKLLELKVDTGIDVRTVVSGIAEHFSADEMIGKKVTVLVNLAPRKIRGIESQGMLLFAENNEGKLLLMNPEGEAENGSTVG